MTDVLALDTGYQTGMAMWREGEHFAWDMPEADAMRWCWEAVEAGNFRGTVVVERITINAHTHKKGDHVLSSVEQIGFLRYLCAWWDLEFTNKQTPGEAKSFSNDGKLKAMGWWTVGSDHARDASRHLMLYLANRDSEFRTLLARTMSSEEED